MLMTGVGVLAAAAPSRRPGPIRVHRLRRPAATSSTTSSMGRPAQRRTRRSGRWRKLVSRSKIRRTGSYRSTSGNTATTAATSSSTAIPTSSFVPLKTVLLSTAARSKPVAGRRRPHLGNPDQVRLPDPGSWPAHWLGNEDQGARSTSSSGTAMAAGHRRPPSTPKQTAANGRPTTSL